MVRRQDSREEFRGQAAPRGDRTRRAVRHPPELNGPLGDVVDRLHDRVVDLVEYLVQGGELRALDVLTGVFHLRVEVDGIRQPVIVQPDGLLADRRAQVILRLEHGSPVRRKQGVVFRRTEPVPPRPSPASSGIGR